MDVTKLPPRKPISLEIVRESHNGRLYSGRCLHRRLVVDTSLTTLECRDCKERINAVEWIATTEEYYTRLNLQKAEFTKAKKFYEAKRKCRCEHCGKMTAVRPATAAQVRDLEKAPK